MKHTAIALTLLALSTLPGLAHAQARSRSVQLDLGAAPGATYTALLAESSLRGERVDGWSADARVELGLYEPGGFGGMLRPFLQLGSPNLLGGEVGAAFRGVLAQLTPDVELLAGGAVGISVADRFYLSGFGLGSIPSNGPADADHAVVGYFAELHLDVRFRSGVYIGVEALHHGFVLDTHADARSPFFSISPAVRIGRTFDL